MTTENLSIQLYKKMFAEQEQYRAWLLTLPPNEILNHAYEYTSREDILIAMESSPLTDKQAKALLRSPDALSDVYKRWQKQETSHMDDIVYAIEDSADSALRRAVQKGCREAR